MNLIHDFYHFQELIIHDFHGFEVFSCNILTIGWHPLNSISGMFLIIQKVKCLNPNKHEGFKITVNSIIEAVQFLYQHQASYVLTERFSQDPLENYFGHQRSLGAREQGYRILGLTIMLSVFRPIAGIISTNSW